jgi:chemotaxis protein histidine kinase CheA
MFRRKKRKKIRGKKNAEDEDSDAPSIPSSTEAGEDEDGECDDSTEWVKRVDETLRKYITTISCRCELADVYFDNPPRPYCEYSLLNVTESDHILQACSCDNGLSRRSVDDDVASVSSHATEQSDACEPRPQTPEQDLLFLPDSVHSTPSKSHNSNGKRSMVMEKASKMSNRRGNHLKHVRSELECWRFETKAKRYSPSPVTAAAILPDPILTTLASNARIQTLDDMDAVLNPRWIMTKRHGQEVLDLLKRLDEIEITERERTKAARKEDKKQKTEERQREKKRQKELEREATQVRKAVEKEEARISKALEKQQMQLKKAAEREETRARKATEKEAAKAQKAAERDARVRRAAQSPGLRFHNITPHRPQHPLVGSSTFNSAMSPFHPLDQTSPSPLSSHFPSQVPQPQFHIPQPSSSQWPPAWGNF